MFHDLHATVSAQSSTNEYELRMLSTNVDPMVRSYVAENRHTPREVLLNLMNDKDPLVHIYLLRNPNIAKEICIKFMDSADKTVRREASLVALQRFKVGDLNLEQKELVKLIKVLATKADTLSIIETVEELNKIRENNLK